MIGWTNGRKIRLKKKDFRQSCYLFIHKNNSHLQIRFHYIATAIIITHSRRVYSTDALYLSLSRSQTLDLRKYTRTFIPPNRSYKAHNCDEKNSFVITPIIRRRSYQLIDYGISINHTWLHLDTNSQLSTNTRTIVTNNSARSLYTFLVHQINHLHFTSYSHSPRFLAK